MATPTSDVIRDRCRGALVGLAIGDALGSPLEFSKRDSLPKVTDMIGGGPFKLKPGEWTDDTSMALCLAESLLVAPEFNLMVAMTKWMAWHSKGYNSVNGRCFDIGNQTSAALRAYAKTGLGPKYTDAAGNGALMRISPVAIRWHKSPLVAINVGVLQTVATHNSHACVETSMKMVETLVQAIHGDGWTHYKPEWYRLQRSLVKATGYVVDTFEAAMWAVGKSDNFEEAVTLAVNLGDDSDTVGAVTGQLAGARWGMSSIPTRCMEKLAWRDRIIELADRLYLAAQ
jgi:ADP-ribosyl-[dinitrogen reductase] hydrolase